MPKDTRWDRNLSATSDGEGLIGHAGAVLLRKLADQAGLTTALGSALARAGKCPLVDRGVALVSMAVAIALGARSMNDITLLAHHALVLGAEPSDTTVRRTLELADPRTLDKIARVRARVRAHVWSLIVATPAGFPWLAIAGKLLADWLVIDLDGTLITAHSEHAIVEDQVRTNKAMGLQNLPSKAWLVNCGWVLTANIAADLSAWCRLLGLYDCDDLKDAEPDTLRSRLWALPARLVRHARARVLKISQTWPWKEAFLACWQRLCALPEPA